MNELSELQKSTLTNLQTQNDTLNRKLGTIDDYLSSKEATAANKTSSDVLKNTVRQLELLK
jgi:conjugal transfer/entry exclusion protein